MPGGRPTDYLPEYCVTVVDHCADGRSLASFCNSIDISRQTLYQWRNRYPEFNDACARALLRAQEWFENQCRAGLQDRNFNSRLAEFLMTAQFRDDYAPQLARLEVHHTGNVNVRSLPREELVRLAGQIVDVEEVKPPELPKPAEESN